MKNCLITRLKGVVDNNELKKFNRLYITIGVGYQPDDVMRFSFWSDLVSDTSDNKILIESGNGYFIKNGVQYNELEISSFSSDIVFGYNAITDLVISVPNKYAISNLELSYIKMTIDADDLKYLTWEHNGTKFRNFVCAVRGELDVTPIRVITNFITSGIGLYGDCTYALSSDRSRTMNEVSYYMFGQNKIIADFSLIRGNVCSDIKNRGRVFPWKGTRTGYFVPIINTTDPLNFGEDLDAMLINQANLEFDPTYTQYNTRLYANGIKTSKSDSAIAVLKEKGLTVCINGVIL